MDVELVNQPTTDPAEAVAGAKVTITARIKATKAGQLKAGFRRGSEESGPEINQAVSADEVVVVVREVQAGPSTTGTYDLWAELDGVPASFARASAELALPDQPETPDPPDDPAAVDLRGLVWDPQFAANTGTVGLLVLAGVTAVSIVASSFLIHRKMTPEDVAGVVGFLGVIIAATAIVGGTWIVAMEFRGRASESKDAGGERPAVTTKGAMTQAALESFGKILEGFAKLRSPIAVLAAGAVVFVAAAMLAGAGVNNEDPPPTSPPPTSQPPASPSTASIDGTSTTG